MTFYDTLQQSDLQNSAQWSINPQSAQMYGQRLHAPGQQFDRVGAPGSGPGLGMAAYGPQYQSNIGAFGQGMWGQGTGWGQQRQLTQQDIGEVVRQLVPLLPQIVAQAQQPLAAFGYGGFGYGPYANQQRQLSPQDINEVVRQILPILPQILGTLQGQAPLSVAAMHGGFGQGFAGQNPFAQQSTGQAFFNQQPFGQFGGPTFQSAYGNSPNSGPVQQQRQLTPQDVSEVVRQLVTTIPQVIGNLQAYGQQRAI